jgi:hypothetical protein
LKARDGAEQCFPRWITLRWEKLEAEGRSVLAKDILNVHGFRRPLCGAA